ncbi:NUDIX domain-containing protein [Alkalibacterium putridalgicola]|uniref:Nudix hydrolase domain-containing protein n=1 Tax=Alkalibacterium putridalgicola TaxID=426703 RepID=A0A1H7TR46_9LACT|nr:NUDIX domain-containing protein [Alkalibacterium putridalgicola]GEK88166.1 hypothetical protein APU01nite_02050 [Alkalibacterium putridalgicola]SEL86846.1 hypothetical protein SAMN04488100_11368 [Alkalibacterium putridalgicola]
MIKGNHYVASTILVKDEEGRYVFLVKEEKDGYSFPAAVVEPKKTGLACVINRLKEIVDINIENLELNELTNAIVHDNRIPLFVFIYEDDDLSSPQDLLIENNDLSWVHSENIVSTLEEWKISGVPQFLLI